MGQEPAAKERLSRPVRQYLVALAASRFGVGLTLPFTLILLHEVRGIPLPTVGLLLAIPGVVGLAAVPVSGTLVDRLGARAVLRTCLLLQAVGTTGTVLAHTPAQVAPALLLTGLGLGPSFPAGNALLSGLLDGPGSSGRAFGIQFTVINAAIGLGTLVGATVVDVHRPSTFLLLYLAAATTCLIEYGLLPAAPRRGVAPDEEPASYREVWSDPLFRQLCAISFLFAMTGYAALDTGLPAFARVVAHVSPATVGLAYSVNTVLIVALQLPVLRWVRLWPRTRALAVGSGLWALSWALLGVSRSTLLVLLFAGLFGLGEVFQSPAMQPLVNALASERLRGRYNALSGSMFSIAFVVSPALSGVLIGNGLGMVWVTGLFVGSVVTGLAVLRLRHQLTPEQDGVAALAAP